VVGRALARAVPPNSPADIARPKMHPPSSRTLSLADGGASLRKLGAEMDNIVSIKVYLTDLAPYSEFSKVRGEVFPHNPPTSTAVQVTGLLLGARIEIDAIAFIAKG
jgi:enamine deaminase RidA (YjgF/YER057c/UK114 family)